MDSCHTPPQPTRYSYGQAGGPLQTRSGQNVNFLQGAPMPTYSEPGALNSLGLNTNSQVVLKRKIVKISIPPRSASAGASTRGPPSGNYKGPGATRRNWLDDDDDYDFVGRADGQFLGAPQATMGGFNDYEGQADGQFLGAPQATMGGFNDYEGQADGQFLGPHVTRGAITDYVHEAGGVIQNAFSHIPEYAGMAEHAVGNLIDSIKGQGHQNLPDKIEQMLHKLLDGTKLKELIGPVIEDMQHLPKDPVEAVRAGFQIIRQRVADLENLLLQKAQEVKNQG